MKAIMNQSHPRARAQRQLPRDTLEKTYPPLDGLTRPTVETAAAAFYTNRKPQTLRVWACFENGPIRPLRVNGRLAWRVADIKELMGVKE